MYERSRALVRIPDLSQSLDGPLATLRLADPGARLIMIQRPGGRPGLTADHQGVTVTTRAISP